MAYIIEYYSSSDLNGTDLTVPGDRPSPVDSYAINLQDQTVGDNIKILASADGGYFGGALGLVVLGSGNDSLSTESTGNITADLGPGNDTFTQLQANKTVAFDLTGGLGDDTFTLLTVTGGTQAPGHGASNFNYNFTFTPATHESIDFVLSYKMPQNDLASEYSHFLQSLIAQGFGNDVNGDGVISYDIGQNHHNPTIEGTVIEVTDWQSQTLKNGQVREVATQFDIRNVGHTGLTSNDGNDVINGFIVGQDHLTLSGTAGVRVR
jgi:hypothetical protein